MDPAATIPSTGNLHSLITSRTTLCVFCVFLSLVTLVSVYLPLRLTPGDSLSRRSVLWLSTLACVQAGSMLAISVMVLMTSAFALSSSPLVPLSFLVGLMSVPVIERTMLLAASRIVAHRRRHYQSLQDGGDGVEDGSAFLHANGKPSNKQSNSLLPPPVPDYRRPDHDHDSDEFVDFDYDDRDQLSPPLMASSSFGSTGGGGGGAASTSTGYGTIYSMPLIDAHSFLEDQRYLARCLYCKDNIHTRKGLAYHAAGCPVKHVHAFTSQGHAWASLRGKRGLTLDDASIPPAIITVVSVSVELINSSMIALASLDLRSLSFVMVTGWMSVLSAYQNLAAFGVGLALRQQRSSNAALLFVAVMVTAAAPAVVVGAQYLTKHLAVNPSLLSSLTSCARAYAGGAALWFSLVEIIAEEMERREAREAKWLGCLLAFVVTAASQAM